jgi:hypothetical protein
MRRMQLAPEVERQLLAAIKSGAHPRVAAVAAGVAPTLFTAWLKLGRERSRGRYWKLWLAVCQARAWARMRAEIEARQKDVKFWLRYGPQDGLPKWRPARSTRAAKPKQGARDDLQPLVDCLLAALEPFPEAKQAVLRALASNDSQSAPPGEPMPAP